MPHGNPKKFTAFRIHPELLRAVQAAAEALGTNVTAAVEEGLRLWLARTKRKAKGDPPATRDRPAHGRYDGRVPRPGPRPDAIKE
jgi:hypothetical protein